MSSPRFALLGAVFGNIGEPDRDDTLGGYDLIRRRLALNLCLRPLGLGVVGIHRRNLLGQGGKIRAAAATGLAGQQVFFGSPSQCPPCSGGDADWCVAPPTTALAGLRDQQFCD